ncbi:MAG TPA: uracil-DNA glycosylase, partial [Xanthobacteraceae bacterium]|nr:uracil-DNA glycosylase [Xanthobacteraceae bacterium]
MRASRPNALDILAFHREAGVDIALEEAPVNRFAESVSQSEQTRPPHRAPVGSAAPSRASPPPPPFRN